MAAPLYRQLLSQAGRLARLDRNRPKQGNLRRAVSSAYYALFHFLVGHACRLILGTANVDRSYRDVLARAFQHQTMAGACGSFAGSELPKKLRSKLPSSFQVSTDLQRASREPFARLKTCATSLIMIQASDS